MKKVLLTIALFCGSSLVFAQNINDHKVSFKYIQLPYVQIDDKFDKYELRFEHDYLAANEDSAAMHQMRQEAARSLYQNQIARYTVQKDSLDRVHLRNMAIWEKKVNNGATNPDGTQIAAPARPAYPHAPVLLNVDSPILHTEFDAASTNQFVDVEGFEEGLGGFIITLTMHPIQHHPIKEVKKGTGGSTKYDYSAPYTLPISVKVETPTQGVILEKMLSQSVQYHKLKTQKSKYDHQLYMLDNKNQMYAEIEVQARRAAMNAANNYLNNQIGFVVKSRSAEIYSVKKFKDYDYTDVTTAFSKMTLALQEVKNDRDRSGAEEKIDAALEALNGILEESNLYDKKARINDKITAMIQCNIAEMLVWKGEFDKADGIANLALNSGEGKAKRHINGVKGFYADQRKRWEVHF